VYGRTLGVLGPKEATPLPGEVCDTCGLPKEVCVCQDLETEQTVLRISLDTRRYGKAVTRIEGFEESSTLREMASDLKRAMATGGTAKKGWIELQGDHRDAVKSWLAQRGYRVEG
jgi:translation initiation factor 1